MTEQRPQNEHLSDGDRTELLALFQNTAEKIAYSKKQQWQLIILFSAFTAFLIVLRFSDNIFAVGLFKFGALLPIGMALLAFLALRAYDRDIGRARKRLDRIYGKFGDAFQDVYGPIPAKKLDSGDKLWKRLWPIYIGITAIVAAVVWVYDCFMPVI